MKKRYINTIIISLFCLIIASCKKTDFLDQKPDVSLVVPTTLDELQSILDNSAIMTGASVSFGGLDPSIGEAAADNIYMPENRISLMMNDFSEFWNIYIWNDNIYKPNMYDILGNWTVPYRAVYYANTALDGLAKLQPAGNEIGKYNNIKGSALFYRSRMFYQLLQIFAPPYNKTTADKDWGIPLRQTSDANEKLQRSNLAVCYNKIIADLKASVDLLPESPLYNTRPSQPAAFALLSKTYLQMHEYDSSLLYADKCFNLYDTLLDYRTLNAALSNPFPTNVLLNKEIIFHSVMLANLVLSLGSTDSTLFESYHANDLRRIIFFNATSVRHQYKAGYARSYFTGIATDEVLLIRAECRARKGQTTEAMSDLNDLLVKRFASGTFTPLIAANADEALDIILEERRKELVMRGVRWPDLKRLNNEGRNLTIKRLINNQPITLPPNDPRYTFLIPPDVIGFHPDMPQNHR